MSFMWLQRTDALHTAPLGRALLDDRWKDPHTPGGAVMWHDGAMTSALP